MVDEVVNGLAYYDYTFLRELPRLYAALDDQLAGGMPARLPSFIRMGSWIGGDRDGNPYVTAEVLRQALAMQSDRVLRFYLEELQALGGELSLHASLVSVTPELHALALRSPDKTRHREDEPYRRAISGIHARVAAMAVVLNRAETPHLPANDARPMPKRVNWWPTSMSSIAHWSRGDRSP